MIPGAGDNRAFQTFWMAPHRPLFLGAFLCALVTIGRWPLISWDGPAAQLSVVEWHVHELIFGFAGATIGGYLLTALPSWTARPPVSGMTLISLSSIWALARLAAWHDVVVTPAGMITLSAGYFAVLAVILSREIIAAKAYQKLGFAVICAFLGVFDALYLAASFFDLAWTSLEMARIALLGVVFLMITIGTRAIPAFTQNWLIGAGKPVKKSRFSDGSRMLAQGVIMVAIVAKFLSHDTLSSFALILGALALVWNMSGWQSRAAFENPLLAALHLAFFWLPFGLIGLGLIGLEVITYPASDAVHAITIGGMSGLIMAIAGRAASHSKSGAMKATKPILAGVALIWVATWCRLAVPLFPYSAEIFLRLSALMWCVGWIAFISGFRPALIGEPQRPILSGARSAPPNSTPKSKKGRV